MLCIKNADKLHRKCITQTVKRKAVTSEIDEQVIDKMLPFNSKVIHNSVVIKVWHIPILVPLLSPQTLMFHIDTSSIFFKVT